jgi:hypothetical protein
LLPLYLTALVKPQTGRSAEFRLTPEKNVVLKRRLGMFWRRVLLKIAPQRAWKSIK